MSEEKKSNVTSTSSQNSDGNSQYLSIAVLALVFVSVLLANISYSTMQSDFKSFVKGVLIAVSLFSIFTLMNFFISLEEKGKDLAAITTCIISSVFIPIMWYLIYKYVPSFNISDKVSATFVMFFALLSIALHLVSPFLGVILQKKIDDI